MAGEIILITGAASGLGFELALSLASEGCRVFGTFRNNPPDNTPENITWLKAEMLELNSLKDLVAQVEEEAGGLDCLLCNAATQGIGHTSDLSHSKWQETLEVNLTAPFLLTQASAPALKASRGLIVYISSVHSVRAAKERLAYAVSKAGLNAMARNVAADFAKDGVRALSLVLGPFHSPGLAAGVSRFFPNATTSRESIESFADQQPLGRVGKGQELASVIRFLMSDSAGFISGTEVTIDGGQSSLLSVPDINGTKT